MTLSLYNVLKSVYSLHLMTNITSLSCCPYRYYQIESPFIKMWLNGTHTVLTPLCQHPQWMFSSLLSHCGWVCKATICSHVAFNLVAFDFKNGLCAYWEKCGLNISWNKYGKWFVMVPEGSSEFHIMSPLSLCPWAGKLLNVLHT